jgi:hypothetical protein
LRPISRSTVGRARIIAGAWSSLMITTMFGPDA